MGGLYGRGDGEAIRRDEARLRRPGGRQRHRQAGPLFVHFNLPGQVPLHRGWVAPQSSGGDVDVVVRNVEVVVLVLVLLLDVVLLDVLVELLVLDDVDVLVVRDVEVVALVLVLLLDEVLVLDVLVEELVELLLLDVLVLVDAREVVVRDVEVLLEEIDELLDDDDVLDVVVAVVLVALDEGVVVDVGGSAATSATNASTASSMANASPVTKQSPLRSSRRKAALNLPLHRERHVTTPGLVSGDPLRRALARQRSRQAPFRPASLNFAAAQSLARSETSRRLCRSA